MKCIINGDAFTFVLSNPFIKCLSLELDPERVIVEHNKTLIKQEDYHQHTVREDDQLELLEFVGGG